MNASSLAPRVLTICCYAAITSIALSQEQSLSSAAAVKPNAVVISIPADGEFYFGKVRIAESEIPEKVKQALKDKPTDEQTVYVKAAVLVKYGTVVSIVDAIRGAGFDQIGLVANKKKNPDRKPGLDRMSFPNGKPKGPVDNSTRSNNATLSAAPSMILIDVRSKTRLKVNSKPIILSRLQSRLHKLVDGRSDKTIFIKAPGNMIYGDVVKVIDIAKSAGAQPIGLQVDRLR